MEQEGRAPPAAAGKKVCQEAPPGASTARAATISTPRAIRPPPVILALHPALKAAGGLILDLAAMRPFSLVAPERRLVRGHGGAVSFVA